MSHMNTAANNATKYPTISIRRPNGDVETVSTAGKIDWMTDVAFGKIKAATARAGRGEALSYTNKPRAAVAPSANAGWCGRCQSYCFGDCRGN